MAGSSNELLVIVLGIYVMLILMIFHVIYFKYELTSVLELNNFKVPSIDNFTSILPIFEQFIQIIIEVFKDKFNIIKDKLFKFKVNPIGLILSLFDYTKEGGEKDSPENTWGTFIQNNVMIIGLTGTIFYFFISIMNGIITGVVTRGAVTLLTNIPLIIGYLFAMVIIFVGINSLSLLFSDNTLAMIQCSKGLDASGNRKDRDSMQDHEKLKMKLCKFWISRIEPVIVSFPTIWGKINNIKITRVIKDETGKAIKILLPGNVIYDVINVDTLPSEDSVEHNEFKASGNRIIYILADSIDLLKKNVYIFKDLKNDIYLHKDIFKAYNRDYKDNMMKFYGYNNIYYMFLHPFMMMMMLGLIMSSRELFIGPETSQGEPTTTAPNIYVVFLIKMFILILPLKHIFGMFTQLDLLKEDDVRPQMILILFQMVAYIFAGGTILKRGVIDNDIDIINSFGISGIGGSIILIFIACAYIILIGDLINCELQGKPNCKATFYTLREQKKTCKDQKQQTDLFTNFSNKHNNNIGYTRIKDQFTQSKMVYKCSRNMSNKKFNKEAAKKFSVAWNKIITGRGKIKDLLYVKKWLFGLLVVSILVGFLLKSIDYSEQSGSTLIASPVEIILQFVPFLSYFNIMYVGLVFMTYSYLFAEQSKNIVPILISSMPDIMIAVSFIMMMLNGIPQKD